ncbi:MAG: O-antigen ligase family protein [Planctomycetota bacterium]
MQRLQQAIPWFDAERSEAAFAAQRADVRGLRVHLVCGVFFCLTLSMPFPMPDIGLAVLLAALVIRLPIERGVLRSLAGQFGFLLALAWVVWVAIGALRNGEAGWRELTHARWALAIPALWPIIEHRRTLLTWWLAGFALGHATQVVQFVDQSLVLGINESLGLWERDPQRISGWWGPVAAGTVLVGVLAARLGQLGERRSVAAGIWVAATIAGIVLTGTRGAWVAALLVGVPGIALLICLAVVRLIRHEHSSERPLGARASILGGLLTGVIVAGLITATRPALERIERGKTEVREAFDGNFDTDTGARLLMGYLAARAAWDNPIIGVGTGGYEAWAEAEAERLGYDVPAWRIHAHAHSVVFHIAATHGVIGMLLFFALFVTGFGAGMVKQPCPASLALLGIFGAGLFESIVASSAVSAHWWFLLAICPLWRPRHAERSTGARDEPMDGA